MRRSVLALVFLALLLPGCANTERPEGIVERWLLSLNQGAAGRPERYADDELSEQVLPGWHELDPGELDVIEVGDSERRPDGSFLVPFRIEHAAPRQVTASFAVVARAPGGSRIVGLHATPGLRQDVRRDRERTTNEVPIGWWLAALAVAGLLIALTAGLMALVRGQDASPSA